MVIRVLAGAVPMITGALIFSGVIPVGKWVMGDAAVNPAEMIRTMSQAEQFAHDSGFDQPSTPRDLSAEQLAALTPEQRAAYRAQRNRARVDAIRSQAARNGSDPDATGWAPSSGGWGR